MPMKLSESFGYVFGYIFGVVLAAGSIIRNSRILHPRGLLFYGELDLLPESPVNFPPHVMIRFSAGWWKSQEWPDALGVALRMSEKKITSVTPSSHDRDLLFASFMRPWQLPFSPFLTDQHDFLANSYFAISPFALNDGRLIDFMIDPSRGHRIGGSRDEKLLGDVMSGRVVLRLMMKERGNSSWQMIARIRVKDELNLDQEALRFHPFMCGNDMKPAGFIQYLRLGTYRLSQWSRPGAESLGGKRLSSG